MTTLFNVRLPDGIARAVPEAASASAEQSTSEKPSEEFMEFLETIRRQPG